MKASKTALADLRHLRDEATAKPEPAPIRRRRPRRPSAAAAASSQQPDSPAMPDPQDATPREGALETRDRALFRHAMRFVKPLTRHGNRVLAPARALPEALLRARREQAQGTEAAPPPALRPHARRRAPGPLPDPEAGEFLQAGCGTDLLRGLRRGQWLPQAILDLHGSTEDEARERLDRFIDSCADNGVRCVRIVHGKGMGSRHGTPVLKSAVRIHLCRLATVQAWVQCAEPDGGAGAVTALLHVRRADAAH